MQHVIGLSIIVNVKSSVQNILFWGEGGGSMVKNVDSVHFQYVCPFLTLTWQNIYLKNVDVYTF